MTVRERGIRHLHYCQVDSLVPHPHNPRGAVDPATVEELAASIREKGILEPILVVPHPEEPNRYLIVAGHRRQAAAKLAGLNAVPVIVRDYSAAEQEEVMLVENLQRAELSPLQEARAYQRIISGGISRADAARRLGINGARIQSRLTILKLPASVQRLFDDGRLPVTLAPLLLRIENLDRQERLANLVASRRLTLPKLKEMVDRIVDAERTEAAVDGTRWQSRRKRERQPPSGPSVTYTRADALADLEKQRSRGLYYSDLLRAFDGVCQNCGMERFADICSACPLPQFIGSLVKEDGDAAL